LRRRHDLRCLDDCNCLRANLDPKPLKGVDGDSRNDLIAVAKVDGDLDHHGFQGYGRDGSLKLIACTELYDGHSLVLSLAEKLQAPN
jgi:hypothetical protein